MKLQKVEIRNFRSIKELDFVFDPACRVLVGINESGKSNILQALAHLDPDLEVSSKDVREAGRDEHAIVQGYIWFRFRLDDSECDEICAKMANYLQGIDPDGIDVARFRGVGYSLREFVGFQRNVLWRVRLNEEDKSATFFTLGAEWSLVSDFSVPTKTAKSVVTLPDGTDIATKNLILFPAPSEAIPDEEVLGPARAENLNELFGRYAKDVITRELPTVIFWRYSDRNLLPAFVDKQAFITDPESCLPLKHMFALAGHMDASEAIKTAVDRGRLRNLLERVAESTTKHMRQVWRDLKTIKVELAENGDRIDAFVRDAENVYEFSRRSDGFKRFFTFLLMVSAKVKTSSLEGAVYLHDEPEIGLHPSGAQFLRDELIKISKTNLVVYSTHSIFMVDRGNIGRHLIVKKDNEITTATPVNDTNIVDEEVIYNALGWSVFESLRQFNVLLEGWRDHRLFKVAVSKIPSAFKRSLKSLEDAGACFAKGCKDIRNVAPLLELANRECVILTDSDNAAKQNQRDYQGWGVWYCYDDLHQPAPLTAEDYVKPATLVSALKEVAARHGLPLNNLPDFSAVTAIVLAWQKIGSVHICKPRKIVSKP